MSDEQQQMNCMEVWAGVIADRFPENLSSDDVTVLVVRATSKPLRHSLRDRLRAVVRLIGSTVGAIRPGAERPPFPDLNAANICGPIVPALERRWRQGA